MAGMNNNQGLFSRGGGGDFRAFSCAARLASVALRFLSRIYSAIYKANGITTHINTIRRSFKWVDRQNNTPTIGNTTIIRRKRNNGNSILRCGENNVIKISNKKKPSKTTKRLPSIGPKNTSIISTSLVKLSCLAAELSTRIGREAA